MLDYIVKPIAHWPGKRRHGSEQKRTPFRRKTPGSYYHESGAPWSKILMELGRELKQLRARDVVLRLDIEPHQLTRDGQMRSNSRPDGSAVMLEFTAEKLPNSPRLVYKCDVFRDWQSNLYAIGRSLEALRMVDRYEVTSAGEQYAGFKQLPGSTEPTLTTEAAAVIVAAHNPVFGALAIAGDVSVAKEAVRIAIARTHPDRNNGKRTEYDKVDTARKVLSSHHGVSL